MICSRSHSKLQQSWNQIPDFLAHSNVLCTMPHQDHTNSSQPNTSTVCKVRSRQNHSALLNYRAWAWPPPMLMTQVAFVWLIRNVPRSISSTKEGPWSSPHCRQGAEAVERPEQSLLFSPFKHLS